VVVQLVALNSSALIVQSIKINHIQRGGALKREFLTDFVDKKSTTYNVYYTTAGITLE